MIFIAGPPCSSKSTTGKLLALKLDLPFHDLDTRIEEAASMSIPFIFNRFGEEGFRRLESEALDSLLSTGTRIILALGGGCLLTESNLFDVRKKGIIITLTASNDVLLKRRRLQKGNRPLVMSDRAFVELLKKRNEHYDSLPNQIDTSLITPEETVLEIMLVLGAGPNI
ncbi:MAG: shikimate kinase AroK [Candidatus Aegiribacteria sp.]|nr:shikimate kinase AroK [Candidatus Aegiribacteria sp.]